MTTPTNNGVARSCFDKSHRICCLLMVCWAVRGIAADVVVIANRTQSEVAFHVDSSAGPQLVRMPARDARVFPTSGALRISFSSGNQSANHALSANSVYYFAGQENQVELLSIGLGEHEPRTARVPGDQVATVLNKTVVVPVKILVDEEERRVRRVWEASLRKRVEAASQVFEECLGVRFQIVAAETWRSNDQLVDPGDLWVEFQREVDPGEAKLAIGFSHQLTQVGRSDSYHLSSGTLGTHVLLPEVFSGTTDAERVDVLVHELGHFLGAAHSPEQNTVMRPQLGDGQARLRTYQFAFDPLNLLVMDLVGGEYSLHGVSHVSRLSQRTRKRLIEVYSALSEGLPEDPLVRALRQELVDHEHQMLDVAVQHVVTTVVHDLSLSPESQSAPADERDAWTRQCVQKAAAAASELSSDVAPKALLLGLGVLVVDPSLPIEALASKELRSSLQAARETVAGVPAFPEPTVLGSADLGQHFFAAAYLTAVSGNEAARAAALARQVIHGRLNAFSFQYLAAEFSGAAFAKALLDTKLPLSELVQGFAADEFVPSLSDFEASLSWDEFVERYDTSNSPSLRGKLSAIDAAISELLSQRLIPQ